MEIKFKTEGQYLGRNGYAKAIALEIERTASGKFIAIRPVNSKKKTGSCIIYVPVENALEVVNAIQKGIAGQRTQKEENIKRIKDILSTWGATSCTELERDHSPSINSIADGRICELVESFEVSGVETIVYDDEIELEYNHYSYEDLSDEIIDEILEIMDDYETDMLKTEKRCQS